MEHKELPGLTIHSTLAKVSDPVPVGINNEQVNGTKVYAQNYDLVIATEQSMPYAICNMQGVQVAKGNTSDGETRIALSQAGVYIVRVKEQTHKVLVR